MKITLIKKRVYDKLVKYQKDFPTLTFQNEGYQYIPKHKLSLEDIQTIKEIEEILKTCIYDFYSFTNFKLDKDNNVVIRFQYNYEEDPNKRSFSGVGYLYLTELLNGFNKTEKLKI